MRSELNFGDALDSLRDGFRPYLMVYTADGSFVPWVISQSDALANDWLEV